MVKNLIRIDDRLIHGQVVIGWREAISPKYIILADDDIAKDEFESEMYLLGVPEEIEGKVLSVSDTAKFINKLIIDNINFIVIVKSPEIAYQLLEKGCNFKNLNVGGMHSQKDKKEFNRYIFVDNEDIDFFKKIISQDIDIYIEDLPNETKYSIEDLINKFGQN